MGIRGFCFSWARSSSSAFCVLISPSLILGVKGKELRMVETKAWFGGIHGVHFQLVTKYGLRVGAKNEHLTELSVIILPFHSRAMSILMLQEMNNPRNHNAVKSKFSLISPFLCWCSIIKCSQVFAAMMDFIIHLLHLSQHRLDSKDLTGYLDFKAWQCRQHRSSISGAAVMSGWPLEAEFSYCKPYTCLAIGISIVCECLCRPHAWGHLPVDRCSFPRKYGITWKLRTTQ